jgi:hypothetical protein
MASMPWAPAIPTVSRRGAGVFATRPPPAGTWQREEIPAHERPQHPGAVRVPGSSPAARRATRGARTRRQRTRIVGLFRAEIRVFRVIRGGCLSARCVPAR